MGNVIESFLSGFAEAAGKLLSSPLQFLAGKSCSSVCGYTWDIFCYIEHFCIANLLKLGTIAALSYIVLLSLYVLYKIGLCGCVGRSLCKMGWACMATYCYACEYVCSFLCHKLHRIRQQRKRDLELVYISSTTSEEEERSSPRHFHKHVEGKRSRSRRWRKEHLRRSLRPRSHRIRVGISGDSVHVNKRNCPKVHDDIRVSRTSRFAKKGGSYKGSMHRRRI
ncbi:hypothetical protein LguiB_017801 [Lonicera macranthoides]